MHVFAQTEYIGRGNSSTVINTFFLSNGRTILEPLLVVHYIYSLKTNQMGPLQFLCAVLMLLWSNPILSKIMFLWPTRK